MAKRVVYGVGDVFEIEIEDGLKGFGRILKVDGPSIFIELYKISIKNLVPIDEISRCPTILSIWSTDIGLKKGMWKIVKNIPIEGEVVMPDFWKKDPMRHDKYLIIRGDYTFEVTKEQLENAQPYGIFGHEAVRLRYAHELKLSGLL